MTQMTQIQTPDEGLRGAGLCPARGPKAVAEPPGIYLCYLCNLWL
jgi:hypothetical protein